MRKINSNKEQYIRLGTDISSIDQACKFSDGSVALKDPIINNFEYPL